MKKFLLTVLITTFFIPFSFAGEWDTNFNLWGIGVLIPVEANYKYPEYQHFVFPQDVDIPVFKNPNGVVTGTICVPASKKHQAPHGHYSPAGTTQKIEIDSKDIREVMYENGGLTFFEEKDGFIRILHHSLENPAWVKLENVKIYGLKAVKWMDFITKHRSNTPFHPHDQIGMNLRATPKVADNKLVTMKGDLYDIRLTGVNKGLWAEVTVNLYDVHPCEGDNKALKSWKGWVKLLDDSGYPNIWFYTRGC